MSGRYDRTANAGFVRWPTTFDSDGGGGGVYVSAVVAAEPEGFATCVAGYPRLPLDILIDPGKDAGEVGADGKQHWPLAEKWFPSMQGDLEPMSKDLLAAVLLGTSGGSWMNADGSHWSCSRADLDEAGEALVAGLEHLYGQPVALLTFLDT